LLFRALQIFLLQITVVSIGERILKVGQCGEAKDTEYGVFFF